MKKIYLLAILSFVSSAAYGNYNDFKETYESIFKEELATEWKSNEHGNCDCNSSCNAGGDPQSM